MEVDQVAQTGAVSTAQGAQSLPFVEKYRPAGLNEIISHTEIVQTGKPSFHIVNIFFTVRKFIEAKNMPHLLFYGPPGTGKTSCMLAIAKEIYGP